MTICVLRLWLPDRPGALGAVASRVGAVGGDVVGIDIVERDGGRAVDELVIDLPADDGELVGLLLNEVRQVDGVDVEEVREADESVRDPRMDALETAAALVAASTSDQALQTLCDQAVRAMRGSWAAVVALDDRVVSAATGEVPDAAWLVAYVEGSQRAARQAAPRGPSDVVWAPLAAARSALLLGRDDMPLLGRERRQAAAMARIVDARFRELRQLRSLRAHPSRSG